MLVTRERAVARRVRAGRADRGPGASAARRRRRRARRRSRRRRRSGRSSPVGPLSVSAHVLAASVTTAMPAPVMSRWRASGSRDSGIARVAHTITTAATGTLMRNAHRQPGPSTRKPPTNGPMRAGDAAEPGPQRRPPGRGPARRKLAWMIARLPGREQRAADALEHPRRDEDLDVRRDPAAERRDREPRRADHEDPPAPVAVAERTADEDQRREREQVAGEHPLEVGDADVEVRGRCGGARRSRRSRRASPSRWRRPTRASAIRPRAEPSVSSDGAATSAVTP